MSLARAIYSDAQIMLFDDPLSAVDPKVSKEMFFDCIIEGCKDKLVILATHQIQYLESCDKIMLLEEGAIKAYGDLNQIIESGFNPTEILDSFMG